MHEFSDVENYLKIEIFVFRVLSVIRQGMQNKINVPKNFLFRKMF